MPLPAGNPSGGEARGSTRARPKPRRGASPPILVGGGGRYGPLRDLPQEFDGAGGAGARAAFTPTRLRTIGGPQQLAGAPAGPAKIPGDLEVLLGAEEGHAA